MPTIFSPAVSTLRIPTLTAEPQSSRKKRKRARTQDAVHEQEQDFSQESIKSKDDIEYTAVVTPLERLQRRVAGQPLDRLPPPFPFPHAGEKSEASWLEDRLSATGEPPSTHPTKLDDKPRSLHLQHLAALTAIVHRSLLTEDFGRAARALGLMLREDIFSRNAAVRNRGYMGIAAEVLLRNGSSGQAAGGDSRPGIGFTREGFQNAKRFYERLIIRHPYHKSWPGAINAVDFYLAMFNIWIYVAHEETLTAVFDLGAGEGRAESPTSSPYADRSPFHIRTKVRELDQANEIANRMDTCMATLPYMDEPELIRLRAMVCLWIADLHDDIGRTQLSRLRHTSPDTQASSDQLEEEETSSGEHTRDAARARDMARDLIARLEGGPTSDE
ncbi:hypothetical protein ABEF95_000642 [Exophiala dermatitidis]